MNTHRFNSFRGVIYGESTMKNAEFAGLNKMTTMSDKKDILQFFSSKQSTSDLETSIDFLKSIQNEIYTGLTKEVDDLKMENKDLKLKLVFLTNSTDILTAFPFVNSLNTSKNEGAKANMLSRYIEELQQQLLKDDKMKRILEQKLILQEKEIIDLKSILNNRPHMSSVIKEDHQEELQKTQSLVLSNVQNKIPNIYNYKTEASDPSLPMTIYGCHFMIKTLVKLRNKMDSEINTLRRKLYNQKSSNTGTNMHNYNYILYKPSSVYSNNSNHSRHLPPIIGKRVTRVGYSRDINCSFPYLSKHI